MAVLLTACSLVPRPQVVCDSTPLDDCHAAIDAAIGAYGEDRDVCVATMEDLTCPDGAFCALMPDAFVGVVRLTLKPSAGDVLVTVERDRAGLVATIQPR